MAQTFLGRAGDYDAKQQVVAFFLLDSGKWTTCQIKLAALRAVFGSPSSDEQDCLTAFEANRRDIEAKAAEKYERGEITGLGTLDPRIVLTSADFE
jgi:hypothetical protein